MGLPSREVPEIDLKTAVAEVIAGERHNASSGRASVPYELESLRRGTDLRLDGKRAATIELASAATGVKLRQLEVVALHDGHIHRITLSAERGRYAADRDAFLAVLDTWRWR